MVAGNKNTLARALPNDDEVERLRDENASLRAQIDDLRARFCALEVLADTDTLTPLPNRRCFERELERVVKHVARYHGKAALFYIDVDGLKRINDQYGHRAGDAALIHLAYLLRVSLRSTDVVARIGGDEFALLIEPTDEAGAEAVVAKLDELVATTPFQVDYKRIQLRMSIGYTLIHPADTIGLALARADADMYRVKCAQRSAR